MKKDGHKRWTCIKNVLTDPDFKKPSAAEQKANEEFMHMIWGFDRTIEVLYAHVKTILCGEASAVAALAAKQAVAARLSTGWD